jgi:hypothetical protein
MVVGFDLAKVLFLWLGIDTIYVIQNFLQLFVKIFKEIKPATVKSYGFCMLIFLESRFVLVLVVYALDEIVVI